MNGNRNGRASSGRRDAVGSPSSKKTGVKKEPVGAVGELKKIRPTEKKKGKKKTPDKSLPQTSPHLLLEEEYPIPNTMDMARARIIYDTAAGVFHYHLVERHPLDPALFVEFCELVRDTRDMEAGTTMREHVRTRFEELCKARRVDSDERDVMSYHLERELFGYKRIDALFYDKRIEDIKCAGWGLPVYVIIAEYGNLETNVTLSDAEQDEVVKLFAQRCNRTISLSEPHLDASLAGGHRISANYGREISPRGTSFVVRLAKRTRGIATQMALGTVSPQVYSYLGTCVRNGVSLLVVGGAACGKTSVLNTLCQFTLNANVISIEDTQEIDIANPNWISLITREHGNLTPITFQHLLEYAVRERPEILVLGEIRSPPEARTAFQAAATGHAMLATTHATNAEHCILRFRSEPYSISLSTLSAVQVFVTMGIVNPRVGGSRSRITRRVLRVEELEVYTGESGELAYRLNPIFAWNSYTDIIEPRIKSFTESRVLSEVARLQGWPEGHLEDSLDTLEKALEWVGRNGLEETVYVHSVLSALDTRPAETLSFIEKNQKISQTSVLQELCNEVL